MDGSAWFAIVQGLLDPPPSFFVFTINYYFITAVTATDYSCYCQHTNKALTLTVGVGVTLSPDTAYRQNKWVLSNTQVSVIFHWSPFVMGSAMTSQKENLCTVITLCNMTENQINLHALDTTALQPNWNSSVTGYNI